MARTRALEPEVYEAGLGRMKLKPIPTEPLIQHIQQSLVLEGDHRVISVSHRLAPPLEPQSHHPLEPFIQHIVQVDVRKQWRDRSLNAKDNFAVEERSWNYLWRRAPFRPEGWVGGGWSGG